ncbi:MAG: DNA-directed RNA polymerase subunit omega [Flavobacteriales bacterium]|jgi:BioD-like phosphotransacetylase family protein
MSNYKNSNAAKTTITRNTNELYNRVDGNLFEAVVLLSKRSSQISKEMKEELNQKLEEFGSSQDNLEEVFENREQIEISRHYERLPKPHSIAVQELLEDKVFYKYPEVNPEL